MSTRTKRVTALTIAGSDPGGGAGVQADIKTFAALKVHGYSAITAVIAQNSSSVKNVAPVAPAMVVAQIEAVAAECRPGAIKTGVLGNGAIVRAVARAVISMRLPRPVVDPVLVSTSGARLLDRYGERAICNHLIPITHLLTPNISEAESLTLIQIDSKAALREAARELVAMGAQAAVIKGGHGGGGESIDLLYDGSNYVELKSRRIPGTGAHGTGCAFSAAIAAYLARGLELEDAVRAAKRYVTNALAGSFRLGSGRPILDHFCRA
ncbi:MAG TPA: bifunctional hydroxymethylpyrimidine kinase/phosphomethylpyrimidine kinase [Candidatus Binataceae bacterium]